MRVQASRPPGHQTARQSCFIQIEMVLLRFSNRPSISAADQQLSQPRVTPDGSDILYVATPKSAGPEAPSSLFAIPVAGGAPRSVLKDVAIFAVECARSPSTICLYSVTKGNTRETVPFDVRSGKITVPPQIDPEGFLSLSPDGSQRRKGRPGTAMPKSAALQN